MNIFKRSYNSVSKCNTWNKPVIPITFDISKHKPLFLLTDLLFLGNNTITSIKNIQDSYVSTVCNYKIPDEKLGDYFLKITDKIGVPQVSSRYFTKQTAVNYLFSKELMREHRYYGYVGAGSYSTYRVDENTLDVSFCLCVKEGYERYIQLCLFTDSEIEFDCFYLLYNKRLLTEHSNLITKFLFNKMFKYCKDYKIDMIAVYNVTDELSFDMDLMSGVKTKKQLDEVCDNIKETIINGL